MPTVKEDNDQLEPHYEVADLEYDEAPQADFEAGADVEYDADTDPDYDDVVQADYELEADYDYEESAQVELVAAPTPVRRVPASVNFAFAVGRPVIPATQQQACPVVWRGLLLEPHPATGLLQRVPVYLLSVGYWDCYREEELQVA